jgi:hypothetical protein
LELKKLPRNQTMTQQVKANCMQAQLGKQIKDFVQASTAFLPNIEELDLKPPQHESINTPEEEFVEPEDVMDGLLEDDDVNEEDDKDEALSMIPESALLPLPSNIFSPQHRPTLESLVTVERELRKGQANDALEGL